MKYKRSIDSNSNIGEIDYGIFCSLALLLGIGIVMVYSASSFYAMFHENDSMYFLKRQLIWAIIGVIAMSFMMNIELYLILLKTWILFRNLYLIIVRKLLIETLVLFIMIVLIISLILTSKMI